MKNIFVFSAQDIFLHHDLNLSLVSYAEFNFLGLQFTSAQLCVKPQTTICSDIKKAHLK